MKGDVTMYAKPASFRIALTDTEAACIRQNLARYLAEGSMPQFIKKPHVDEELIDLMLVYRQVTDAEVVTLTAKEIDTVAGILAAFQAWDSELAKALANALYQLINPEYFQN